MDDLFSLPAEGKLTLKNFDAYAKQVAEAYQARPAFEQQYARSWKALIESLKTMYKRLQSKFKFEFVSEDPYTSMEQMRQDVKETGTLKIYTGHSNHPVWTPEENHIFRAVHDALGHLAGYQKGKGHRFDLRGELGVYNRQYKVVPHAARDALFTELVGQVCTGIVTGGFPEQKVTKLFGFDYSQVGKVDEEEYQKNFDEKSFKQKLAAKYIVAAATDIEPPKAIHDYILGLTGLPSRKDPAVKKYYKWLQTQLDKKTYRVYRALTEGGPIDGEIFADDPMSFTESKTSALAIAKDRFKDSDGGWIYVVAVDAPKDRIYFHHRLGGKLGKEHPKEKEIMVLAKGLEYEVIKEYEGS